MTTKHTPGPWQINFRDKRQVCDADGEVRGCSPIAHCVGSGAIANARLIASAPALLAALQALEWAVSGVEYIETEYAEQIAQARTAIAQATGGAA